MPHRAFAAATAFHRFRSMRLTQEYETLDDPFKTQSTLLPFLMKRTRVSEIIAAKNVVFVRFHSGLCSAFSRETNERICILNLSPDEAIHSLFYNKNNDSLISVSGYGSENFGTLKCRSTKIEYLRMGKADAGFPLLQSESLKWPGYIEFNAANGKILTHSAHDSVYKVFDLKDYTMLYSISDRHVKEIKICPGVMLLISYRVCDHIPLLIVSIEDGTVLKVFNHILQSNKVVLIESCNEKLLVKQENKNLQILDVPKAELMEVNTAAFRSPSSFIFLYQSQLFLAIRNHTISVWNFRGELVTAFDDHQLWHAGYKTNDTHIIIDQDLIISYCKAYPDDQRMEGKDAGSINVSNILDGTCVAKIDARSSSIKAKECSSSSFCEHSHSFIVSSVTEALEDITALTYDEDRNEIYTGNRYGLVHVWSNS
uniref:Uncharacterized protein n=2 Tax=Cajanus cajan TaxID=3821 RepID=A0A151RIE4_CAJCA|nr:hypothetical protein KK1_036211 [Cajanus cajan]